MKEFVVLDLGGRLTRKGKDLDSMTRLRIWAGLLIGSAVVVGCGDDPVAPNRNPTIEAQRDTTVSVGGVLRLQARGQDPDGDKLTYHLTVFVGPREPLPDAVFDGATGELVFTAAETDTSGRQFKFTAQDGRGGEASTTFTVEVNPVEPVP